MNREAIVYAAPIPLAERLGELGIDATVLRESAGYGVSYARECTFHDPPSLAGVLTWGKTVRALRDRLVPLGWTADGARNYATIIHPSLSYGIAVAGGDSATGLADKTPSTRSEKGPATRDAVTANQLSFAMLDPNSSWPEAVTTRQTWLLLIYCDEDAEQIRVELSLPAYMTEDGHVVRWQERLILPPIALNPSPITEDESDEEQIIDVPVKRRRA